MSNVLTPVTSEQIERIMSMWASRLNTRGLTAEEAELLIKYQAHYLPSVFAAADAVVDKVRSDLGQNTIVRMVRNIRRDLPFKKALGITGYEWNVLDHIGVTIVEGPEEVELVYFKLTADKRYSAEEIEQEYVARGLHPDLYAQVADNAANPAFAETRNNVCMYDRDGIAASTATFYVKTGKRILRLWRESDASANGAKWSDWFGGVRK